MSVMLTKTIQDKGVYELARLTHYTEGPAIDRQGNVYVTTLTGGDILKIGKRGKMNIWAHSPCPNGQLILPNGDHIICDSKSSSVRVFDADGEFYRDLVTGICAGVRVQVPNDLAMDSSGNLFFTDSVREEGKVFKVGKNGEEKLLAEGLDYPNGLVFSGDGKYLYVAESYRNRILKFELNDISKYTVLADLPSHPSGNIICNLPDGLAIDHKGAIWVAHYGMGVIHQYSQDGQHLCSIQVGMPLVSNIAFIDSRSMVVTGGFGEPGPGRVVIITI